MNRVLAHFHRRSAILLSLALIGVMAAVPSASAGDQHGSTGATGGTQRFLAVSTNYKDDSPVLLAYGPIHAKGSDITVSNTKDRFKFANGSVNVTHHVMGTPKQTRDKKTCTTTYRERGTYRVTGGTGAYAGASGSGHYVVNVLWVGCSMKKPPAVFMLKIQAIGPINF